LICKDLLQEETIQRMRCSGEVAAIIANDPNLSKEQSVEVEIYRPREYVRLCQFNLMPDGKKDFSLRNLTKFLEMGGLAVLRNKLRVI